MIPVHDRIIVKVSQRQKDEMYIGDVLLKTALPFENNHREKSPVLAEVVEGNKKIKAGQIICCHHNHYSLPSPYYLYDNLFSIPFKKTIFGSFDKTGNFSPLCGNMICKEVFPESQFLLPEESRKPYIDRYEVIDPGNSPHYSGQIVFTRPHAGYWIVYHWDKAEKRLLKVDSEQVCGILLS